MKVIKSILKIIGILILVIFLVIGYMVTAFSGSVTGLEAVDEDGLLYHATFTGDYNTPAHRLALRLIRGAGCSAFAAVNEDGDVITGRNYDLSHMDKDGNLTGLNMVLEIKGDDIYDSINGVDLAWVSALKIPYYKGALSDKNMMKFPLGLAPYLAVDGINEEGLSVSVLALDIKDGETAMSQNVEGKEKLSITELLRKLLDHCADVEEATAMIKEYNVVNTVGHDYHIFVTDSGRHSIVCEWRNNELKITETDAVTNFYVGFDDAEDFYVDGVLKDKFVTADGLDHKYNYGYGHGYSRFKIIAERLNRIDYGSIGNMVSDSEAWEILRDAAQEYDGNLTSFTQYSVVYNNSKKTATYSVWQDYENKFEFSFE